LLKSGKPNWNMKIPEKIQRKTMHDPKPVNRTIKDRR
jgi:hypothetical protein